MAHPFYCFLCSWISFPCLYLDNNFLISFFIVYSAKSSLCLMISFTKLLSASLGPSKRKVFDSVVTMSSIYAMYASIITITWLNCCELFWWFYYVDKIDAVYVWFRLFELFSAFIRANNFGSLVNSLFGVKFFDSCFCVFFFFEDLISLFLQYLLLLHPLLVVTCLINLQFFFITF